MILISEKLDNYQHKINHEKQMLLDYDNKILKYDNYWFLNEYDRSKYKLIKRRKHLIKSEFGLSYLPLRTYKNKLTNEIITPTRTYIDIDKYKNYTNWVNKLIILNADLNNITYPIIKHNLKISISLSTICRRLKKTTIFVQELPQEKIKILPTDYIYIQSDESYNNLIDNKKKRKFRHRTVSISTGFDLNKSTDNRHVLENKYIFVLSTKKGQRITKKEFGKSIITNLDNIFIGYTNENLKLTGDGATYLKSTANYLNIDYAVDKWHPLQKLKQLFIVGKGKKTKENNKKLNYAYYKLFLNGNYYKLLDYLKENNADEKIYEYFKNNKKGIENQNAIWNIGCSAESDVYHLIKSISNNNAKIYSKEAFFNLLKLKQARINKLKVFV
ncbi:Mbov_0401 family ICE element transposase-like protein [Spiroplasma endosymbiont of Villa modesta]|uniref:Mbov_0401 family ICE element transposase-like protein n=1 Tax=Spiroplasma endosymbiont of Villa modesta TaxID=3066293 RepID=UPI00313AF8AF